jgi:hypothetical protein
MNKLQIMRSMRSNLVPLLKSNQEVRALLIALVQQADNPETLPAAVDQLRNAVKVIDSNEFLFKKLIGN